MSAHTVAGITLFVLTYALMLSGRAYKAVAALCGGCAMILFHVTSQEAAFEAVDLNVIFLLAGMMIIVHFLAESGFFGYVAIRLAQVARGRPIPLLVLLCAVTAGLSALVDNVTTVLLIAPVTFLITEQLEISPMPYVLFEAIASNVGGTATLIGDPPNILIGSAAGLGFNDFLAHLFPVTVICLAALLGIAVFVIRKQGYVSSDIRAKVMEMRPSRAITDAALLKKTGLVFGFVLAGLLLHGPLGLEPAAVALTGAAALLLVTHADPSKAFGAVEWPTLFFFVGLFMVVEGLRSTGLLAQCAGRLLSLTGNDVFLTAMVVLWFAAVGSALIGAVPLVTMLIPVVQNLIPVLAGASAQPESSVNHALWWSLALGACLGGNGTFFGTAANIVVVEIARSNRRDIGFRQFMYYGLPVTLATLIISSVYVGVRYVW